MREPEVEDAVPDARRGGRAARRAAEPSVSTTSASPMPMSAPQLREGAHHDHRDEPHHLSIVYHHSISPTGAPSSRPCRRRRHPSAPPSPSMAESMKSSSASRLVKIIRFPTSHEKTRVEVREDTDHRVADEERPAAVAPAKAAVEAGQEHVAPVVAIDAKPRGLALVRVARLHGGANSRGAAVADVRGLGADGRGRDLHRRDRGRALQDEHRDVVTVLAAPVGIVAGCTSTRVARKTLSARGAEAIAVRVDAIPAREHDAVRGP